RVVRADGDERAHAGEGIRRAFERIAADVLDHDVDAGLAGPPLRLLDEVLRPVVDHVLGAEAPRELDLVVAADRRHDTGAAEPRDLNRRASHTAPGCLHQHGLARAHVGLATSACHDVSMASGTAAPASNEIASGNGRTLAAGALTRSA